MGETPKIELRRSRLVCNKRNVYLDIHEPWHHVTGCSLFCYWSKKSDDDLFQDWLKIKGDCDLIFYGALHRIVFTKWKTTLRDFLFGKNIEEPIPYFHGQWVTSGKSGIL